MMDTAVCSWAQHSCIMCSWHSERNWERGQMLLEFPPQCKVWILAVCSKGTLCGCNWYLHQILKWMFSQSFQLFLSWWDTTTLIWPGEGKQKVRFPFSLTVTSEAEYYFNYLKTFKCKQFCCVLQCLFKGFRLCSELWCRMPSGRTVSVMTLAFLTETNSRNCYQCF